ncbi:hypothetical protein [Chryseobacterium sp.]|uniref:hypothetical protein n=1 Tax=Chryseobacterium sp. TaxID=1871047 RepID=UPI0028A2607B|nr:hypothetical protein [Chryseobacterium sp.]
MKNLIISTLMLLFSCNENISKDKTINYNYKKNTMKNIYYLNYDLSGEFDIIFNGVLLTRNKKDGVMMNYEYLNPYINTRGKQTITLFLKSLTRAQKISPKVLKDISLELFLSVNKDEPPLKKVQALILPEYKNAQDSILYTWTFDADVPFEIKTLTDAKDLSKENQDSLLKEVVEKYNTVRNLINDGKTNKYMDLYKKSREREMISMYYDEQKQKEYLSSIADRAQSSKDYMQPLKNYKIFIHPNNKLVELMINDGQDSALYSVDKKGKRKTYGLQLYRSLTTGKLEVY